MPFLQCGPCMGFPPFSIKINTTHKTHDPRTLAMTKRNGVSEHLHCLQILHSKLHKDTFSCSSLPSSSLPSFYQSEFFTSFLPRPTCEIFETRPLSQNSLVWLRNILKKAHNCWQKNLNECHIYHRKLWLGIVWSQAKRSHSVCILHLVENSSINPTHTNKSSQPSSMQAKGKRQLQKTNCVGIEMVTHLFAWAAFSFGSWRTHSIKTH